MTEQAALQRTEKEKAIDALFTDPSNRVFAEVFMQRIKAGIALLLQRELDQARNRHAIEIAGVREQLRVTDIEATAAAEFIDGLGYTGELSRSAGEEWLAGRLKAKRG